MLAKYINENQIDCDRSKVIIDDMLIINPTDEQLISAGYMAVVEEEYQENAIVQYSVENEKIIKKYIPVEVVEVQSKPTQEQALRMFAETLADSETNSIAKIRAAAQEFLNNTEE